MKTFFSFALFILLVGCASSPSAREGDDQRDLITREQIAEAGAPNLYELVRRLRWRWLPNRERTYTMLLYIDEAGLLRQEWTDQIWAEEDLDLPDRSGRRHDLFLRHGGTEPVQELRWLTPTEARALYRGQFPTDPTTLHGAIVIQFGASGQK
jgi:hypothetical protein